MMIALILLSNSMYSQFIFIILLYFIYFTMLCVINQDTLNVCVACVGGGDWGIVACNVRALQDSVL